ncbi:TPA: hypothetical protein ACH3X2_010910 [Trebouxia sp. C0005]
MRYRYGVRESPLSAFRQYPAFHIPTYSPSARATVSAPQVTAAGGAPGSAGRKRKTTQQRLAAKAAASQGASGSTQAAPPVKLSFADVVAGRTTPEQTVAVLVSEVQRLKGEVSQARAFGERTYDQLQQEKQSNTEQLERLHRHSKRNNLIVFGVPESAALQTPAALARHLQGLLFQTTTASGLTQVRSAFRLGKWKQDQSKPRAVLVELLSVAAKHTAFQASSRLRADSIRLDEDLTPQQMKQRRNMSVDFQCLKARGYKPFFRGVKLRFRDGAVIRTCAKNEANKVVAAAAQAARATPPLARHGRPSRPCTASVAMDPSAVLHRAGVSILDQFDDPAVAHAAQAVADDFAAHMAASDEDVQA